jgi:Cft2 family RNA processing exonuclease
VSYQIEDTPGRILMDKGEFVVDGVEKGTPVKAKYSHFDFSSHSGQNDLIEFLTQLKFSNNLEKRVFCVHGDKDVMMKFAEKILELSFKVETPVESQSFKI